jgi:hypothetical protein
MFDIFGLISSGRNKARPLQAENSPQDITQENLNH